MSLITELFRLCPSLQNLTVGQLAEAVLKMAIAYLMNLEER